MLSKGVVKLKGWKPRYRPDPAMCRKLQELVVRAVYSKWSLTGESSTLQEIYRFVRKRIEDQRIMGKWKWSIPGKRTVDRRVNEASDRRFYSNQTPKIVSVTAGIYTVNPELLEDSS